MRRSGDGETDVMNKLSIFLRTSRTHAHPTIFDLGDLLANEFATAQFQVPAR